MKDILDSIEWASKTIEDKLTFGLSEEQAGSKREARANGVLMDCKEHIQLQASKLEETQELCKKLIAQMEDFKNFGTRHDLNPTGQMKDCGCFDSFDGDHWQGYIKSQDRYVRNTSSELLSEYENLIQEFKKDEKDRSTGEKNQGIHSSPSCE